MVRVRVTDALDNTAETSVTLKITGPMTPPLVFTASAITAEVNLPFSYAFTASGGTPPYTWAALGPLPAGLSAPPSFGADGVITGTPTTPGAYTVSMSCGNTGRLARVPSGRRCRRALPSGAWRASSRYDSSTSSSRSARN